MKTIAISANHRSTLGSKNASQLRKEEKVPAVLYGGKDNMHFSLNELDIKKITHTPLTHIVELDVEGAKKKALLKEVQYHPLTDRPIHVDFIEVEDGKPCQVELAIKLVGQSAGVRQGGKLQQPLRKLKVVGIVTDLPEELEVDISTLKIGETIRVRDLKADGVTFLGRADGVVAAVKTARTVVIVDEDSEEGGSTDETSEEGGDSAPAEG
jgi:large subunit ribosomal protein L25